MVKRVRTIILLGSICFIIAASVMLTGCNSNPKNSETQVTGKMDTATSSADLAKLRGKLSKLEKAVSEARAKGINTGYEDITVTTAGLFLNKFIPYDIAHPAELAAAYSRSRKQDLKGTPQEEAARTPVWELSQTSDILDGALAKLAMVRKRPDSRRPVPNINGDHLKIVNGFLSADDLPTFSGGLMWAPIEIDSAYFGRIGVDVGPIEFIDFSRLQSDGTLSDSLISGIIKKMDVIRAKGLKGSIPMGNHNVPLWAVNKWPDIVDYKGHFFEYDIDHPQVRGLWKNFFASLVPKIRNHPAKFDYQLAIEPMWPSVGTWMTKNASPYTFKKYQKWLGDLYDKIGALNTSWGTGYSSFTEITSRPADKSNPAMWYDWCRFNQWRVTDFFKFMQDEIHKYDPDGACQIRISIGSIDQSSSAALQMGIDREPLVKILEINGLDGSINDNSMPASSGRTYRPHTLFDQNAYSLGWLGQIMVLDFIRSLGPDKLIYNSEWHSASTINYINPEPRIGYMHTVLWLSTLHGMGASKHWFWSRKPDSSPGRVSEEFYGSTLVQPRLLNEYGVGLAEINAFAKEVVALERVTKQIYLLYSESSAIQASTPFPSDNYLNNQMIAYEALQFTGLPIGFVTENDLRTTGLPAGCKWLVIADDRNVSQSTLDWLRAYVKGGGKLLVIGNNALKYNEYGKANSSSQLDFVSSADKLDVVAPPVLLGQIEALMSKTAVSREIRCTDNMTKQTAFGVMCRSVEYQGGHLVCLINVASVQKEVSLEQNGKMVTTALDLFENKVAKISKIKIEPLTVRLFQVSK